MEVFIRSRPTPNFASKNIKIDSGKGDIQIHIPRRVEDGPINHQPDSWAFKFDRIFINETQEALFESVARKAITSVASGVSATIIAYGQTGAGKTFTISGVQNNPKYRGILPRAISAVFKELEARTEHLFKVRVSFVEIYNEVIHDLLRDNLNSNIALQEDPVLGVIPQGALLPEVKNEEEALCYMFQGETNKTIDEHKLNKSSSRSHVVFTVYIESRPKFESPEKVTYTRLNILDLAGSERTKKTNSSGATLLEASFINKSLSYLEQLVVAFNEKNRDFLPYRQSKLTYMLKEAIGGNSRTIFVTNIWPEASHLEETISALRFASRMSQITNAVQKNTRNDPGMLLKLYEKQIKDLKCELAMHDTLAGRGRMNYEAFTPEQQFEQQQLAEKFFMGAIDDIDIGSIRQVKELFAQFRNLYKKTLGNSEIRNEKIIEEKIMKMLSKKSLELGKTPGDDSKKVGREEPQNGFGLGKAPLDSRPPLIESMKQNVVNVSKVSHPPSAVPMETELIPRGSLDDELMLDKTRPDKQHLFSHFKENQGRVYVEVIRTFVEDVKEGKAKLDAERELCEDLKSKIDDAQATLKSRFPDSEDIDSEERQNLVNIIKSSKAKFKNHHQNYLSYKHYLKEAERKLVEKKKEMVEGFGDFLQKNLNTDIQTLEAKSKSPEEVAMASIPNIDEVVFERTLKKFETLCRAKKMEKAQMIS